MLSARLSAPCRTYNAGIHRARAAHAGQRDVALAIIHPFVDGNERIAFAAADVFLRINGWRLQRAPLQIHADMTQTFDTRTFDIAHLDPWLRGFAVVAWLRGFAVVAE